MSDVVISMGDMGDGGDHTKRENPCRESNNHADFENIRTGYRLRRGLLHSGKTANLNCKLPHRGGVVPLSGIEPNDSVSPLDLPMGTRNLGSLRQFLLIIFFYVLGSFETLLVRF